MSLPRGCPSWQWKSSPRTHPIYHKWRSETSGTKQSALDSEAKWSKRLLSAYKNGCFLLNFVQEVGLSMISGNVHHSPPGSLITRHRTVFTTRVMRMIRKAFRLETPARLPRPLGRGCAAKGYADDEWVFQPSPQRKKRHTHTYTFIYKYMCMYVCACVISQIYIYIYIHIYIYIYIHIYIYT